MKWWWRRGPWRESSSRCQPFFVVKTCQGKHRPGKIAEVPYEVPAVPRGETTCPVCRQVFKTHHCIRVHMGVHRGEKFPCGKCGKVLVNRRYLVEHTQACVQGNRVPCPVCNKNIQVPTVCASTTGPNMGLIQWFPKVVLSAHFAASLSRSKRHGGNTSPTVLTTLIIKVLIIAGCRVSNGWPCFHPCEELELAHVQHSQMEGEAYLNWWASEWP